MDPFSPCKSTLWQRPQDVIKIKKMKQKKRVLEDRLFDDSPTKKSRQRRALGQSNQQRKRNYRAEPPPPDEATCDDSTLLDLLNLKSGTSTSLLEHPGSATSFSLSPSSGQSLPSPGKWDLSSSQSGSSPLSTYLPPLSFASPKGKRQTLLPASPSQDRRLSQPVKKLFYATCFSEHDGKKEELKPKWQTRLCLDWSLKNSISVVASKPFGWANHLKTSEESSGISAFVRCINIEPQVSFHGFPQNSALDTSLGAQFHQCCLYWQHPNLPGTSLFPRTDKAPVNKGSFLVKADATFFNDMHLEWIEALRSIFQLLRARQCPFFYVCGNNLTILFCAAGIQGNEQIQAYVTPSSRGLREALKSEGIEFTLPHHMNGDSQNSSAEGGDLEKISQEQAKEEPESDEEADKWLDEMGISQDINYSANKQTTEVDEEKSKSSLVMITGSDTLSFFNFLVNSKNFLVSPIGAFAGIPPTIIAPVTFHGATLKTLLVKQTKLKNEKNESDHVIEMTGPILPHVIHMLSSLLNKNVQNFKIILRTLNSSIPFNIKPSHDFPFRAKPSAFELQNLSDCGLKKDILETFCCCDNCDTIKTELECCNSLFQWK